MSSRFLLPALKIGLNEYVTIFLIKTLPGEEGAFIRRRRSETLPDFRRGVYWKKAFKRGRAFIGGFTVLCRCHTLK